MKRTPYKICLKKCCQTNTMDAKGEVLLTIMASLAQQESQSLSQNVKLGLQYRYQQGKVQVNHNRFMGYTKDEEGNLIIVPEEADIIKRIYREYLEGKSLAGIGRDLEKDGILTAAGKPKWRPETIKKILMNEKSTVMPFYRRPSPWIFLQRKELRMKAMSHNTTLKTAMRRSYQRNFFYRLRKNFIAGIIFIQEQIKTKDSIAVNML